MADKSRNRTPVEHVDERELLDRASGDDADAVRELYRRSASSAWGVAVAVTGRPGTAAEAVASGFEDAIEDLRDRTAGVDVPFRPQVLAATRHRALEAGDSFADHVGELTGHRPDDDPATATGAAFAELPEAWRSALWLSDVEMLGDDQLAAALDETPETSEAMVKRAREVLHQTLQARMLASVDEHECELVTSQLGDLLAGHLDDLASEAVQEHLGDCGACRERREQLVSATDRLGTLEPPLPDDLERTALNRWRGAVGLPLLNTGRTAAVRSDAGEASGEHPAVDADPGGPHPFDVPEPALVRWRRALTGPGPITASRSRRALVGAAVAALVVAGGLGAAVHKTPSMPVRTALAAEATSAGNVGAPHSTLPPITSPTTLPPLASGFPVPPVPGTPVAPAGSGQATSTGGSGSSGGSGGGSSSSRYYGGGSGSTSSGGASSSGASGASSSGATSGGSGGGSTSSGGGGGSTAPAPTEPTSPSAPPATQPAPSPTQPQNCLFKPLDRVCLP